MDEVVSQDDAKTLLHRAGDSVLVKRGVFRSFVMKCPCGCNDDLVINLDPRMGKAWRLYIRRKKITIFPSVWRDSGCQSHFVIWNSRIYWYGYEDWSVSISDKVLEEKIKKFLQNKSYVPFYEIAETLDEIPWKVLESCKRMVSKEILREELGPDRGKFKLNP